MENTRKAELTEDELKALNKAILGYGRLTDASKLTGLHVNTIRIISFKGYGSPDAISKIRTKLLIEEYAAA